ncbi:flagellin [Fodinibius sediminis]|uniref:Flagellin n=1 Tax=Fodinibius sediminis TaxID=1214077 RepID=A0A521CJ59_9BACT|nr:flagellin [Fodinibius sediminis]SMO59493.1 flagellin [Fodinibius sediminis]
MSFGDINRVNTNIQALNARYSLNKINSQLGDNQLKLSTGLRINKAEDDAAGFSIASKLSSRLEGMEQAQRNIGDAKAMLDVAESGMNSIMDTLIDMKSKAVQGASDTVGSEERGYIQDQINQLAAEIDKIANGTEFQGKTLLDGTFATTGLSFQVGEGNGDTMEVTIASQTGAPTLGGATQGDFSSAITAIDSAISSLAGEFNQIGIDQNSLSIKQDNLAQQINSNESARSRIQDADFAKLQSESVKLQIMQQTATSAFAQANAGPQTVLNFLG